MILLNKAKMKHRDPKLFYLTMEVGVRKSGTQTQLICFCFLPNLECCCEWEILEVSLQLSFRRLRNYLSISVESLAYI